MGGSREVVPCRCSAAGSRENEKLRHQKVQRRITRDTGKVFHPERNRHVTTPEMAKKVAENLAKGMNYYRAFKDAGFPKSTCKKSGKAVNRMIRTELMRMGRKYIRIGKQITAEDQEALVRGKLVENILRNSDKGVLSAKQLGADKRVAMWTPDSQVGMVILKPPPIAKIDHEVPLIETRFQKESAMLAKSQEEQERHRKKEEVEDDSADLRLSPRR